jgi:N-acetylneuraminic acid mutarotase
VRVAIVLVAALICASAFAADPVQRTLSFEDRVMAQTAIERVYYSHQIGATKPFGEAVPKAVIEAKVRKYLEQTAALSLYWKTAVTDQSLQRELERIAQGTRMPERLTELHAALGNDPFLVKECLARATLVDRLTQNFYAFDSNIHAKARAQAAELHRKLVSGEMSPGAKGALRTVDVLRVGDYSGSMRLVIDADELRRRRAALPPSTGQPSDVEETRDAFSFEIVLSESPSELRVAHYAIPKISWDSWWEDARVALHDESVTAVASGTALPALRHAAAAVPASSCQDDRWDNGILDDVPTPNSHHTAVWTGTVMIVWGGYAGPNGGRRYDPATDTWLSVASDGAPSPRFGHTAVWTGDRMIVWGGCTVEKNQSLETGGRYDPVNDRWTPTATVNAPSPRRFHTAIWSGQSMVIWGGAQGDFKNYLATGGRYDPATDTWTTTATVGAPTSRVWHTSVWTGTEMVVWGGRTLGLYSFLRTGGRYDPLTDSWTPMTTENAPAPREEHTAVWTGDAMIVWGGYFAPLGWPVNGGVYHPATDTWTAMSTIGAPAWRFRHAAVWTGTEMLISGGSYQAKYQIAGGRYNPATNTWLPMATAGSPSARDFPTAVWTGNSMIVWGGQTDDVYQRLSSGGRYDPSTDSWTPTSTANGPAARFAHSAVWTGNEMIVWGGRNGPTHMNTGGRYDPTLDRWSATKLTGAPSARADHTAVWTGSLMVVWGGKRVGSSGDEYFVTGGRYDTISDSWSGTTVGGAPERRAGHSAVWTGDRMVVWGGYIGYATVNSGGVYDPIYNSWSATRTNGAVPVSRTGHSAVWTGTYMVIWGGSVFPVGGSVEGGGRYDPSNNSWSPISTVGAPNGRFGEVAVWTGNVMTVWGGRCDQIGCPAGGRYDPVSNVWSPISTVGAPSGLVDNRAVSTGNLMLVTGGGVYPGTSKRYDPVADLWSDMNPVGAPMPRANPTAVWTGSSMIVWGGLYSRQGLADGGQYIVGTVSDDDCDGDGLTAVAGDCNDRNANVYPGAAQICDGVNDDCDDPTWPAIPSDEIDYDEDGAPFCRDCDDYNGAVYAGAATICDGLNNNCDDPAWPAVPVDETDGDGDGAPICHLDCDDANPQVGPGFWEQCDGYDNDCNGIIDDLESATVSCEDGNPCSTDFCDSFHRTCVRGFLSGVPCDDRDACTLDDTCVSGSCQGMNPVSCSAPDSCWRASCSAEEGCRSATSNLDTTGFSLGRVDGRDLAIFAEAWNSCYGDDRFNRAADLDLTNDCVEESDFHVFMNQFGRSCSP